MRHRPHLYLPSPWTDSVVELDDAKRRHLMSVLRYPDGSPISYTDGSGALGTGHLEGGVVVRGDEDTVPRPSPEITIGVAPPASRDRQRFLVEKLQELGVAHLRWLSTDHTQGRPPQPAKALAWCAGALEQSRGAWLTSVDAGSMDDLRDPVVAEAGGVVAVDQLRTLDEVTVLVGPEGGFSASEIDRFDRRIDLGPTILRTETAAIVAASLLRRRDV